MNGLARIETIDKQVIGCGCFFSGGYVLTCAHVYAIASGQTGLQSPVKTKEVLVAFPFSESEIRISAVAEFISPQWDGTNSASAIKTLEFDCAILKLQGKLPKNVKQPLISFPPNFDNLSNQPFIANGFPEGFAKGDICRGIFVGESSQGLIKLEGENAQADWIREGFSGTPVRWADSSDSVVGIMALMRVRDETQNKELLHATMLSMKQVRALWPGLPVDEPTLSVRWEKVERSRRMLMDAELLIYMPDRKDQEDNLIQAWGKLKNLKQPRPLVCLAHGTNDQSHEMLMQRIQKRSLPRLLRSESKPEMGSELYTVTWDSAFSSKEELKRRVLQDLAGDLFGTVACTPEEANARFADRTVLVQTYLNATRWDPRQETAVANFFQFWHEWPVLQSGQRLLICILVTYEQETWILNAIRGLFKDRRKQRAKFLSKPPFEKFDQVIGSSLGELADVSLDATKDWVHGEVQKLFRVRSDVFNKIDEIYETVPSKRLPMERLAGRLRKVLPELIEEEIAC